MVYTYVGKCLINNIIMLENHVGGRAPKKCISQNKDTKMTHCQIIVRWKYPTN